MKITMIRSSQGHQSIRDGYGCIRGRLLCMVWLAVMVCCLGLNSYAQENKSKQGVERYETWLQTVYSMDNGLPVGKANDIVMTRDGIIWVGTYAGLYRYNGTRFQLMNQYETVPNVECLYVDDEDRLWVGTNDNGISVFQNEELAGVLKTEDGLPSDAVRSIVKGADGLYYVGTSECTAVVSFEEKPGVVQTISEIKYADKSTADADGNVVMITSYGTMFLLRDGVVCSRLDMDEDEDHFTSCVFDVSGRIHVGTSLGRVLVYEVAENGFRKESVMVCTGIRKVNNLIRVNESTIFLCADNGIGYFDEKGIFHKLETQNFKSAIYHVILDYQGNLWFSSTRMGLLRLCKTSFVELFTQYSVTPDVVNTVERFDGALYIGTDSGLVIIDEEKEKKVSNELTSEFGGIRIRQIFRDSRNHLWLCTYGKGLAEYDGTEVKYYGEENSPIGGRVRTILECDDGTMLASSEKGLAFLLDGTVVRTLTEQDGLANQTNLCMLKRPDGTILVGSDGSGITEIRGDEIRIIEKKDGLPSDVILRMANDTAGDGVFIITGSDLCYMEADGSIRVLNHFPYSNNYDLIQQEDSIFVLGSAGIYAVLREELLANEENMKCTFLDNRSGLHDALIANSWILHESARKRAYLATSSGVTMFDLKEYGERPENFRMRIASISVDGETSQNVSEEHFSFSKTVHRLEILPEIINYSTVDPVISCYLEGFDRELIVMPQSELSTIVYTNLPPGKYNFHMTLVDSESGVSVSEKVYHLEKETAFTDTVWFYILVIGALVLIAMWIDVIVTRRLYIRRLNAKEKELEKSWRMSLTDALTGLKNRFAMRAEFPEYIGKNMLVTMMDIDYFKQFNDTYGHEMGDVILKSVGEIIRKYYRDPSAAFRFGGDEFLLLDLGDSEEEALEKREQMKKEIESLVIPGCGEQIHISCGSIFGCPQSEEELRDLRERADERLYEEKKMRSRAELL